MTKKHSPPPQTTGGPLVGIASSDITPPVGIILSGYRDRISTSIGHRLRAEAMVCKSGRTQWALITAEMVGFSAQFTKKLRQAVTRQTGIPGRNILLTATHTHSGPRSLGTRFRPRSIETAYQRTLLGLLTRLVSEAQTATAPAVFEAAMTKAPDLGHNRRIKQPDGTWGNDWQDPTHKHSGYFDPTVLIIGVRRPHGMLDALLVNFGSHPVVLGPKSLAISGDYVSYLKDALEKKKAARTVLFGLAGHANINPPVCIQKGARHPRSMGKALADIVLKALPRLRPLASLPIAASLIPWNFRATRPVMANKPLRPTDKNGRIHTELMALGAGDLGFIGFPGELFSEYTSLVRKASPFAHTVVLSQCNDYIGYLPTDQAQTEGAYETHMAPATRIERPLRKLASKALRQVAG